MSEWVAFWNSDNSIYVNARHRDVHYRVIAEDICAYVPGPQARVLDYGCGEALHADLVAARAGSLTLSDAAPAVRARLEERLAVQPNIEVRSPEDVAAMPAGAFDLVIMNSVAQYLRPEELEDLLQLFRKLLRPGGRLVLGDVVPPTHSMFAAAASLLRFAARNGFLLAALGGLARTAFSNYRALHARVGLTFYDEAALRAKLEAAGFAAERARSNIGHDTTRMTFLATAR